MKAHVTVEKLHHFRCHYCKGWWTVKDARLEENTRWFCTWCGLPHFTSEECGDAYHTDTKPTIHSLTAVKTGKRFPVFDCTPADVHIEDVARALSNVCRYGGMGRFYSVAEHSVLISHLCSPENALWGLLHDAAEAYVGDIRRPLKAHLPGFVVLEDHIFERVKGRFGLEGNMPPEIKHFDSAILYAEAEIVLGIDISERGWLVPVPKPDPPLSITVRCLEPRKAERAFLDRYAALKNAA